MERRADGVTGQGSGKEKSRRKFLREAGRSAGEPLPQRFLDIDIISYYTDFIERRGDICVAPFFSGGTQTDGPAKRHRLMGKGGGQMAGKNQKGEGLSSVKRLNHLIGEIEAAYHESSLRLGIADSVSKILYTICITGDRCPLSEICRQTGLSKQTVNSALRRMETDHIVFLEAVDGKAKDVCLTEYGMEFTRRTAQQLILIENRIFASWDASEVQQYLDLTERFLKNLKEQVCRL